MIFSSTSFLLFLIAVLVLYANAKNTSQRASLLLVASLVFYASWRPAYLLLLATSLSANYLLYNNILRTKSLSTLTLGVVINLAALGVIKYLAMLVESILWVGNALDFATQIQSPNWVHWALPLGVSFYTFHMLSALIDAYRGVWTKPVTFRSWCLYVTFFPHLIAGPILRPGQLIDQLDALEPLRISNLRLGAIIFAAGLAKKTLLADNLAPIVDKLYASPGALDFQSSWLATFAFAFQIYFDFSGYSEMAIGLARMLGVELPRNFLYPYHSRSPSEFWRRWHITLSQWLRDYLYVPLGGSRGSVNRTYTNLMVTMFLGGLWHGASWTFAFWGLLHGLYLVTWRLLSPVWKYLAIEEKPRTAKILDWAGLAATFALISFTWVFFRAPNFSAAWIISGAMIGFGPLDKTEIALRVYEQTFVLISGVVVMIEPRLVQAIQKRGLAGWWSLPFYVRGTAYALLALAVIVFGGTTQKFIYFDF